MPEQEQKVYEIAGKRFRMEPLTWQQARWLGEFVFKSRTVTGMDQEEWLALFLEHGPTFFAITLIEEGQTIDDKIDAGLNGVRELEKLFNRRMLPSEFNRVAPDFFTHNPLENLWMFMLKPTGQTSPTQNGSMSPSASSAEATSRSGG